MMNPVSTLEYKPALTTDVSTAQHIADVTYEDEKCVQIALIFLDRVLVVLPHMVLYSCPGSCDSRCRWHRP